MSQCYGCSTCKSADKPLEDFIRSLPMETSHHRVETQRTKCGFGLQGVCCRLCANGPCRITPSSPRGICGANADTLVKEAFQLPDDSDCYELKGLVSRKKQLIPALAGMIQQMEEMR